VDTPGAPPVDTPGAAPAPGAQPAPAEEIAAEDLRRSLPAETLQFGAASPSAFAR
jgi:hypothetical protein